MSTTRNKTFDCVEFKRQAQRQILAEWRARKAEFASYTDFLEAKANESEWERSFWATVNRRASGD